jgi:hypothetical protein
MTTAVNLTIQSDHMLPRAIPSRRRDSGIPTGFRRRSSARRARRGLFSHAHNRSCGPDSPIGPWPKSPKRLGIALLRLACAVTIAVCFWPAAPARSATTTYSIDPSAAMGRAIPVAFGDGGVHTVFLLDAPDIGEIVGNWVTVGNAMNALTDKGISVVAPAPEMVMFHRTRRHQA